MTGLPLNALDRCIEALVIRYSSEGLAAAQGRVSSQSRCSFDLWGSPHKPGKYRKIHTPDRVFISRLISKSGPKFQKGRHSCYMIIMRAGAIRLFSESRSRHVAAIFLSLRWPSHRSGFLNLNGNNFVTVVFSLVNTLFCRHRQGTRKDRIFYLLYLIDPE